MKNEISESILWLQNEVELNFLKLVNPIDSDLISKLQEFSDSMKVIGEKFKIGISNVCTDLRMSNIPQCNFESDERIIYPRLNYKIIID